MRGYFSVRASTFKKNRIPLMLRDKTPTRSSDVLSYLRTGFIEQKFSTPRASARQGWGGAGRAVTHTSPVPSGAAGVGPAPAGPGPAGEDGEQTQGPSASLPAACAPPALGGTPPRCLFSLNDLTVYTQ